MLVPMQLNIACCNGPISFLLDLSQLNEVTLRSDTRAVVGAGGRLGPLYAQIWQQGKRVFPGGTCPTVGVGGHLLGTLYPVLPKPCSCSSCL